VTDHVLRFPGTLAGFTEAFSRLNGILDRGPIGGEARFHVELVFDEIAANIIRHAHPRGAIEVSLRLGPEIVMTFEDDGVPFDPCAQPEPPVPTSLEGASPGGRGLLLVRTYCTRMDYLRTPQGRNRLTVAVPAC
jgi:anti-sigma regulatory factor (Ser/Thr protein kinase)